MKKKNWLRRLIWRLQFKKVTLDNSEAWAGRCIHCAAGRNDELTTLDSVDGCWNNYCPCDWNEHLRLRNKKK